MSIGFRIFFTEPRMPQFRVFLACITPRDPPIIYITYIMTTAIEFENISKQYRLGLVSTGTLSHDLNRFWQTKVLRREDPYLKVGEVNDRAHKGNSDYVWALKDINFKVEQGDVVGIIGRNGAGKSTLLKLLSRVTAPTTGTIRARGRIASLLEVGTGFHPEKCARRVQQRQTCLPILASRSHGRRRRQMPTAIALSQKYFWAFPRQAGTGPSRHKIAASRGDFSVQRDECRLRAPLRTASRFPSLTQFRKKCFLA